MYDEYNLGCPPKPSNSGIHEDWNPGKGTNYQSITPKLR